MKKILFTFTLLVLMGAVGHSVEVGFYPGLDELIEKADAIVILRIGRPVTDFGSPALYSTHDCYIYQTLKGDIPANTMVRLQLLDTRTQFVPPYALLSTHLMFLTKKRSPDEPTEYRTLEYLGSNVRLSPFGHEKMPEGKTIRDRIISDIARTIAYNEKQHEQEQAFLNRMIQGAEETLAGRPISWAQPMEVEGVPNLHRVSPDLYRSAQPTSEGMRNLKRMGIETIVNLRSFHSDRDEIGKTDLQCERIHMKAWHPERDEAVRFLRIVMDPKRTPVLVHCQHGADRTGTMCALYRIAVQGWTKEEAIREMTAGGYGFHEVFDNLPEWIEELDIESIEREAGLGAGAGPACVSDVPKDASGE